MKQDLLITGASGMVGRPLAEHFALQGWYVHLLSRHPHAAAKEIGDKASAIAMDLEDGAYFDNRLDKLIDAGRLNGVVHLAAMIKGDDSARMRRANTEATERLWQWAMRREVPAFILTSTYNFLAEPHIDPITEAHPVNALNSYARSKWEAEGLLEFSAEGPCRAFALRLSSPVPPRIELMRRTVVRVMLERASTGGPVLYFGDGQRRQNFLATDDIAQAVECCLKADVPSGVYNIAASDSLSMRELAELIAGHFGVEAKAAGQPDPHGDERWDIDISKARKFLGFSPRFTSDGAVRRLLDTGGAS